MLTLTGNARSRRLGVTGAIGMPARFEISARRPRLLRGHPDNPLAAVIQSNAVRADLVLAPGSSAASSTLSPTSIPAAPSKSPRQQRDQRRTPPDNSGLTVDAQELTLDAHVKPLWFPDTAAGAVV